MAFDLIFRRSWTVGPSGAGIPMRLDLMLGDATALTATPTIVDMPDDVVVGLGKLKMGYEKRPLGSPEAKSLTLAFDLHPLNASTDLQALRDGLTQPAVPGGVIGTMLPP